jgi:hypothetical protein
LISIHSAEENKFAIDLANRDKPIKNIVWIGAKRKNSLDHYEWSNGQEFNYSNWVDGLKENFTAPETYIAMMQTGRWIVFVNSGSHGARLLLICESHPSDE